MDSRTPEEQKNSRKNDPQAGWQTRYRPFLDRAIFAVALLGVLVSVHLIVQQGRGFDRGCFGFTAPEAVEASFDCELVVQSDAGTLFGISNGVWGVIFYVGIVGLSLGPAYARKPRRHWFKGSRAALIGIGFFYSVYLSYVQYVVLEQWCALCLISSGLATVLFVLLVTDIFTHPSTHMNIVPSSREIVHMGIAVVLVAVLVGADVVYFNQLDATGPSVSEQAAAADSDCYLDPARSPIDDYASLISSYDATRGDTSAPVTVLEFLDPNCPHCATNHEVMKEVLDAHEERLHFVYKPLVVLGQHSVVQVAALYLAEEEGLFEEMLQQQFERQQQEGLALEVLHEIAEEIGMNTDNFAARLQNDEYLERMQQERELALEDVGVNSVPTILVNGRFVPGHARDAECLGELIEEASAGA